jgi:hypothetical protein
MKKLSKTKYYTQKTNIKATMLGDLAILLIPVMIAAVEGAPDLPHLAQYWIMQSLAIALVVLKFVSKLWKEDEPSNSESNEDNNTTDEQHIN